MKKRLLILCFLGSCLLLPMACKRSNIVPFDEPLVRAGYANFDEGMAHAREVNKPVVVDFSGFGSVNNRIMEAHVWSDLRVKSKLENDYVLITLMVDAKTPLAQEETVTESNGKTRVLKTMGDKWSYLQRTQFGTNSQPHYVLLAPDGTSIGRTYGYDENADRFLNFLDAGLNNWKKKQEAAAE